LLPNPGAIASVRKVELRVRVGAAAHAFDLVGRDPGVLELGADTGDEIDVRLGSSLAVDEARVELCRDLFADLERRDLDARPDRGEQLVGDGTGREQLLDRARRDVGDRPFPAAVRRSDHVGVAVTQQDRHAVGGQNPDDRAWIGAHAAGPQRVGLAARVDLVGGEHDIAVNLSHAHQALDFEPRGVGDPAKILGDGLALVAPTTPEVEGREPSSADTTDAGREAVEDRAGKMLGAQQHRCFNNKG
jgi:hypothetical protein